MASLGHDLWVYNALREFDSRPRLVVLTEQIMLVRDPTLWTASTFPQHQ